MSTNTVNDFINQQYGRGKLATCPKTGVNVPILIKNPL